ncbi:SMP-30/gluconolactonase/LRE family protein [Stenotrophomonas sp. JAG2]|uniref:SMP-30/gluconolactonase/LRE family protein n=1 Tax=Stenotrophomonas sp. JAG2 TaxID=3229243 RepID=UPI0034E2DDBC
MPDAIAAPSTAVAAVPLLVDSRCTHGEGALWSARRQCLFWVDISERRLWQHRTADGSHRSWLLPDRPGCLAEGEDGRLLIALAGSLQRLDLDRDGDAPAPPLEWLADVQPEVADTRSNDGRTDRAGNLVFGTMSEDPARAPLGRFYQFSMRHGLRELNLPAVVIPNAICFSPDGTTMYFCDSVRPALWCCDYDAGRAHCGPPRLFAALPDPGWEPDGAIVDAEGGIWNAQWRASRVVRYRPDGQVDRVVLLPVRNPTCVALGGPSLRQLMITSSRLDHTDAELAASPRAGGVFALETGIAGLPEQPFSWS